MYSKDFVKKFFENTDVYILKFFNFRKNFAIKWVLRKMFLNNWIDLICITHYLSKIVLNYLVVAKRSFDKTIYRSYLEKFLRLTRS